MSYDRTNEDYEARVTADARDAHYIQREIITPVPSPRMMLGTNEKFSPEFTLKIEEPTTATFGSPDRVFMPVEEWRTTTS